MGFENRPKNIDSFLGQEHILDSLIIFINGALKREDVLDHTLFYGPPGLGKTTLANIIANEMGAKFVSIAAPSIEKPADLIGILTNLEKGDVFFIDEIHRLPISLEEILYSAMEDCSVDIVFESGVDRKAVTIDLEPFSLIGATTRPGSLSGPLKDRFGIKYQLKPYDIEILSNIIISSAIEKGFNISHSAAIEVAKRSRMTPRLSLSLLRRVIDFAIDSGKDSISTSIVKKCAVSIGVDELGLLDIDRAYLEFLRVKNRPVGLKFIAAAIGENPDTIENDIEPYLIGLNLIERTPSGRILHP